MFFEPGFQIAGFSGKIFVDFEKPGFWNDNQLIQN